MRIRIAVLVTALLIPAALFAQTNEVAVSVNHTRFDSTSETDPTAGATFKLKFESKAGYGISFNHFFSPNLSTELQAQTMRTNSKVDVSGTGIPAVTVDAGTLDLHQYAAVLQWYFGTAATTLRPHVGLGLARIQGGKATTPAELTDSGTAPETISLDDKTTWTADAGVDIRVTGNAAISLTAQYTPYKTHFGADPADPVQQLKLNPLTLAAGLRWRF